jgi:hypothetical protein
VPEQLRLNSYAVPAAMTVALLAVETIYLAVCLPETRGWVKQAEAEDEKTAKASPAPSVVVRTPEQRVARLHQLERIHLAFLFFFAGAEVTLSFLTHNFFGFSNMVRLLRLPFLFSSELILPDSIRRKQQNGRLLGFIGVLSSLLQGGYTRRRSSTPLGTSLLASSGLKTCTLSLFLFAALPSLASAGRTGAARTALWLGAAGLAFVSASVVNSLNALASFETDPEAVKEEKEGAKEKAMVKVDPRLEKGAALGRFRSRGQLGRALGPLVTTGMYFVASPTVAYGVCGVGMVGVVVAMGKVAQEERVREKEGKKD